VNAVFKGYTHLCWASMHGCVPAVACLLEHGADADMTMPGQWIPLGIAACCGHQEVVGLLVEERMHRSTSATVKDALLFTVLQKEVSWRLRSTSWRAAARSSHRPTMVAHLSTSQTCTRTISPSSSHLPLTSSPTTTTAVSAFSAPPSPPPSSSAKSPTPSATRSS
jgi:ankyrin repeat protein